MGQKDITEKVLEDYNDVFADIINGLLFGGEQEIKPEDLENTTVHAQYKAEDDKVHELERDIAKYWKEEKVELASAGLRTRARWRRICRFASLDTMGRHIGISYSRKEEKCCRW